MNQSSGVQVPTRGFSKVEFTNRCARVQAIMKQREIDVLWLSTEADIRYLTGFLTQFWQSPTRPWYLLLPQSGEPVAVIPAIGAICMQRTWINDIRLWSSPHPTDDGVSLLIDTIHELAGHKPSIGVPMGAETYVRSPWNDIERIRKLTAGAQWVDATDAMRCVRQIKSSAEIEKLDYICTVASNAFADVPQIISAGMTQVDAFRAFRIACLQHGADDPAYVVGAASANGYEDIISPPSEESLKTGDILILDTGCTFDGYYADFDRNFALQQVDKATAEAHQRAWDATEAGIELIKPGVTCAELFAAMQVVMSPMQIDGQPSSPHDPKGSDMGKLGKAAVPQRAQAARGDVGRLGHGLGIQLTETPSITAFDHTPMVPGMVMTLEPGYSYAPGKMMVHEENLLVTETGARLLSRRAPRDIPIIK
ncbi:MAG: M24 family metallopeptidase [Granulosicoccus sp.]